MIHRRLLFNAKTNLQAGQDTFRQSLRSPKACVTSLTQSLWPIANNGNTIFMGYIVLLCVVCGEEQSLLFIQVTWMQIC